MMQPTTMVSDWSTFARSTTSDLAKRDSPNLWTWTHPAGSTHQLHSLSGKNPRQDVKVKKRDVSALPVTMSCLRNGRNILAPAVEDLPTMHAPNPQPAMKQSNQ
jgi:hypothetical protein